MRIALTIERFDPGFGGVESAAFHLADELARREHEVTVFCREAGSPPAGVRVTIARVPRTWQPLRIALFSRQSRRAVEAAEGAFDVVHGFSRTRHQNVYRAGGGSHAEYMERVYARPGLQRWTPRHRAILSIEEAVFRDSSQLVQCNAKHTALAIGERYGVPSDRLAVVYNGVDVERFRPGRRESVGSALRRELDLDGPVAVFVGTGFARKGLDRAIEGLADSSAKADLVVAGRGDPESYRALAERRGVADRVHFVGERTDVEALHAAADLFVLPTRYDAFANSCLEAMASGLPVATTPTNGAAELIEHGANGWICDSDFAPAFELLGDRNRLAEIGSAARATAEHHTWAHHAADVLAMYERAVS